MKNIKKLLGLLMVVMMTLSLVACGGGSDSNTTKPTNPKPNPTTTVDNRTKLEDFYKEISNNNHMAAVALMGNYYSYEDYIEIDDLEEVIENSGLKDALSFIEEIDDEHLVYNYGSEVYCIVPKDENTYIIVYGIVYDETTYEAYLGDVLYENGDGQPIIVVGNEGEYIPNLFIEVIDDEGNTMEYIPGISGYDGRLTQPDYDYTILDFTNYDSLGYTYTDGGYDEVNHSFLYDRSSWVVTIETEDGEVLEGNLYFDEYGNLEFCHELSEGQGYELYYEGSWYLAEDDDYPANALVFELDLDNNLSDSEDSRDSIYTVMSFEYAYEEDTVYMYYEDYDLLFGVENSYFYELTPSNG